MARERKFYNILDAKWATGVGNTIMCRDFRNAVVTIATASSANLTCKCVWAVWESAPTFTSAQSVSNMYDYLQMVDLNDGSTITWDTWFVVTGTDDFRQFEININSIDYINFNVTARSAGTVTVNVVLTDNY